MTDIVVKYTTEMMMVLPWTVLPAPHNRNQLNRIDGPKPVHRHYSFIVNAPLVVHRILHDILIVDRIRKPWN